MWRWLSRQSALSEPDKLDAETERVIAHASDVVRVANESLHDACASLDCDEREKNQNLAYLSLTRLQWLLIEYPYLKLPDLDDFRTDLQLVTEATKARRRETGAWRR